MRSRAVQVPPDERSQGPEGAQARHRPPHLGRAQAGGDADDRAARDRRAQALDHRSAAEDRRRGRDPGAGLRPRASRPGHRRHRLPVPRATPVRQTETATAQPPRPAPRRRRLPTGPTAPVIAAPAQNSLWNTSAITVSGTAKPSTTIGFLEGAVSRGTTTTTAAGTWSAVADRRDGTHVYTARADASGATPSPASAARTVRIDTTAPPAPVIQRPPRPPGRSAAVTLTGTGAAGRDNRDPRAGHAADHRRDHGARAWTATVIALTDGTDRFVVTSRTPPAIRQRPPSAPCASTPWRRKPRSTAARAD